MHAGLVLRDLIEHVASLQEQQGQLAGQGPISKLSHCRKEGLEQDGHSLRALGHPGTASQGL